MMAIKRLTAGTDLITVLFGEAFKSSKTLLAECPEIDIIVKPTMHGLKTNNPQLTEKTNDMIVGIYPEVVQLASLEGRSTKSILTTFFYSMYIGMATIQVCYLTIISSKHLKI